MAEALFEGPGGGRAVGNLVGGHVVYKARGERTAGRVTAFETVVAPGEGPPVHTHAGEDETLYVLEGEVRFKLANDLHTGSPGSFAFVPRGTMHTFQNIGDGHARMLVHFSPSGMERFFDDFAALHAPDARAFARIGAKVETDVVGPPLGQG